MIIIVSLVNIYHFYIDSNNNTYGKTFDYFIRISHINGMAESDWHYLYFSFKEINLSMDFFSLFFLFVLVNNRTPGKLGRNDLVAFSPV